MPKDNIERAIAKGTGEGADADAMEAVMYEGYAAGGVALLIEAMTDNRNRTGADVRHLLSKHGGSLGEPGSVAYNFDKKGVIVVDGERYGEDDLMVAIEAGADDIGVDDDVFEITTAPGDLMAVRRALEEAGVEIQSAEVSQLPKARVALDEDGRDEGHAADRRPRGQRRRGPGPRELRRARGGHGARRRRGITTPRSGRGTPTVSRPWSSPPSSARSRSSGSSSPASP